MYTLAELSDYATNLGVDINSIENTLETLSVQIQDAQGPIQDAVELTNNTFLGGFDDFRSTAEAPSTAFENTGRFVAFAVIFGMVILLGGLSTGFSYGCKYPRWTSTINILLWFFVALLMLLGVGLFKGVNYVTTDGCLYAETFIFNYAVNSISSPKTQELVRN